MVNHDSTRQKIGRVWKTWSSDLRTIVEGKQRRASKYIPKAKRATKFPHVHGLNRKYAFTSNHKEVKIHKVHVKSVHRGEQDRIIVILNRNRV